MWDLRMRWCLRDLRRSVGAGRGRNGLCVRGNVWRRWVSMRVSARRSIVAVKMITTTSNNN